MTGTPFVLPDDIPRGLGNCGLVSIAVATGIPYSEVDSWFRNRHLKGSDWDFRLSLCDLLDCLHAHGLIVDLHVYARPRPSLERFVREIAEYGTTYIVNTHRHFQLVRDAAVLDQNYPSSVRVDSPFFGRRRSPVNSSIRIAPDCQVRVG